MTALEGVSAQIRRTRLERGWTQKQLGARAGVDQSVVSMLERMDDPALRYHPRIESLNAVVLALGKEVQLV